MDFGLKNRLALVTASGRGIGRAIAKCLAREGARVAVMSRTQKDIDSLLSELGAKSRVILELLWIFAQMEALPSL